ncbi:inner membrane protein [Lysinibacillus composti]|uniref:Metal-dependent hydrolase n=1 Tax=Lysinibacillus composti TaxID=720633 RepID=A0A3N9UJB8_9BACI|nr:metal-dependent hydrolase [Lysinibacillus composti]MBM7607420.1 inner membrane protein [Lysinibacillus composti]RQW76025.1 metal-dependent hydrolase [Lysinibacillus composti]
MNKPAHLSVGLTVGIATAKYLMETIQYSGIVEEIVGVTAVICGALFGSLLPDIDHPKSYIGRRLRMTSFMISKTFGHRGIVHTPIVVIAFTAFLYFLTLQLSGIMQDVSLSFVIGLGVGMLSHLLLDMMNKRGIPFFYPFTSKTFHIATFKTGGIGDTITNSGCILLIIWMLQDLVVGLINSLL